MPNRDLPAARRPSWRGVVVTVGVLVAVSAVPAPAVARAAVPAPAVAVAEAATVPALGPERVPACSAVVATMAPRARLAQRLMIGVDAADPRGTAETVRELQVGGVFVGGNATALLRDQSLRAVQAVSRIPLAVAVDDEGGRVQRIDDLDGELPSARRMAAELTVPQVRELGRQRARALRARGITMNLGPTVDVGDQPARAVIGDRAFGADPATVVAYAGAFAQGQRASGILPVLKHFPGHGHADGDSHRGRVATPPLAALRETDLVPYAQLLGVDPDRTAVMVGHLDVPGLTTDLPTSLTPAAYALLRADYGFDGLVVTDDLGVMKAVTDRFDLPEAVERALSAGADMALWAGATVLDPGGAPGSGDLAAAPVLDRLVDAVQRGRLDTGANDRAVERVLAAKGGCVRS